MFGFSLDCSSMRRVRPISETQSVTVKTLSMHTSTQPALTIRFAFMLETYDLMKLPDQDSNLD